MSSQARAAADPTTTSVKCVPSGVVVGQEAVCTATVTDTSSGTKTTPTGEVTFGPSSEGSFSEAPCTLKAEGSEKASCAAKYTPSQVGTGTQEVKASYVKDSGHEASSGSTTVAVSKRATTTTVKCVPSGVVVGQEAVCTATVTDTSPGTKTTPTGKVTFGPSSEGSFSEAPCTLKAEGSEKASCAAKYTPSQVGTGTQEVKAAYGADPTHEASSGSTTVAVAKRATTTTVKCVPSGVVVGQEAVCTATVTDTSPGAKTAPTGEVTFGPSSEGSFSEAPCTLTAEGSEKASCAAKYTPSQVGTGTQEVKAAYGADPTHEPSSGSTTVAVSKRATTTSVKCVPSGVVVGQEAVCTATVTDTSPGAKTAPTGKVTFGPSSEGSFSEATCTLTAEGSEKGSCAAKYTPSQVGTGTQEVKAAYGAADPTHEPSSGSTTVTVAKRATSLTVSCGSGVLLGQEATCAATVTDASPGAKTAPTGKVTFGPGSEGSFSEATCNLKAEGSEKGSCDVKYTPSQVGSGTQEIKASYGADPTHVPSAGSTALPVKRATSVTISCGSGVVVGQAATCTVTVSDTATGTRTTPGGTVILESNTGGGTFALSSECMLTPVSGTTEAGCIVSYTPGQVGSGMQTITATYSGDATHASSENVATLAVSAAAKSAQTGGGATTTTTTTKTTTPPAAPKCRLEASEHWKTTTTGKRHRRKQNVPMIVVSYTCDQNATVRIAGALTIPAAGRGRKRTKARTLQLTPAASQAIGGKAAPAVVLGLPTTAAKALTGAVRERATVTFTVKNANGIGVANLALTLIPHKG